MTPRDSQIYTRVGALLRFMGGHTEGGSAQPDATSTRSLFRSKGWKPFSPLVSTPSKAYASTFPSDDGSEILITVVSFTKGDTAKFEFNLGEYANVFDALRNDGKENGAGAGAGGYRGNEYAVYDVWHGAKLEGQTLALASAVSASMPTLSSSANGTKSADTAGTVSLSVPLDDSLLASGACAVGDVCPGFGAILLTKLTPGSDNGLQAYLARMQTLTAKDLAGFSCEGGVYVTFSTYLLPFNCPSFPLSRSNVHALA